MATTCALPSAATAGLRVAPSPLSRQNTAKAAARVAPARLVCHPASTRCQVSRQGQAVRQVSSPRQHDVSDAQPESTSWEVLGKGAVALAASAAILLGGMGSVPALAEEAYTTYYGTAASASSYGGYGGNSSKKDSAEYVYEVPESWKERNISKVEKGTNGTDSEFFNPKKRTEKTYLTFLSGFRRLPLQENVLNNLALSDVNLQDQIASADSVTAVSRREDGQEYYEFEIDSPAGHSLISVTCTKNKLYAHYVNAPAADWTRDQAVLRHIHESFKTIGIPPPPADS